MRPGVVAMPISGFCFRSLLHHHKSRHHRGDAKRIPHHSSGGAWTHGFASIAAFSVLAIVAQPDSSSAQSAYSSTKAAVVEAQGSPRYALVIGNAAYGANPLDVPLVNARAMAEQLGALGFETKLALNTRFSAMKGAIEQFGRRLKEGGIGIFYYSGYATQSENKTYLLPVDSDVNASLPRPRNAINASQILQAMERPHSDPLRLVILDVADARWSTSRFRSVRIVNSLINAPPGFLIAYASWPDSAPAPSANGTSPYTEALITSLSKPGRRILSVFNHVREALDRRSGGQPVSWYTSSLTRDFTLNRRNITASLDMTRRPNGAVSNSIVRDRGLLINNEAARPPPPAHKISNERAASDAKPPAADDGASFEQALWSLVKNSKNPADFDAYLAVFPSGRYAKQARAAIERLGPAVGTSPVAKRPKERPAAKQEKHEPKIQEVLSEYEIGTATALHEKPSVRSRIIGEMKKGEKVFVVGRVIGDEWYRVTSPDGRVSYVATSSVHLPTVDDKPSNPAAAGNRLPPPPPVLRKRPSQASSAAAKPAVTAEPKNYAKPDPAKIAKPGKQTKVSLATPEHIPSSTLPDAKTTTPKGTVNEFRDCPNCPIMVRLPADSFVMGSKSGDRTEAPVRTVRIRRPFAIGKYEVTVGQWRECVAAGACAYKPKLRRARSATPMYKLSWNDANAYLDWLSKVTGHRYRLPSEAEWEYAARGGTSSAYWWGNEMTAGMADCKGCGSKWNYAMPANVGLDKANPFGLHGMSGGVWEWTADCWHNTLAGAPHDERVWTARNCQHRVLRGGAWRNDASYVRSSSRFRYDFNVRYTTNGFRVVRELP